MGCGRSVGGAGGVHWVWGGVEAMKRERFKVQRERSKGKKRKGREIETSQKLD